jgi:NitT/TauT family transport system substrate-binding protein
MPFLGVALFAAAAVSLAGCAPDSPAGGGSANGSANASNTGGGDLTSLVVSEPAHNLGYLPLYIAIHEGIFAEKGLDVSVTTQNTGGGAHVNAVLAGQAWGFIGGPEHNGFVKAQDSSGDTEIKAIANVVNRGNVYLVARAGLDQGPIESIEDAANVLKGKSVVTGAYGGTPNSILRYILEVGGLSTEDVKLTESADAAAPIAIVQQNQADFALIADPIVAQGVAEGVWDEPIMSVPTILGDYAYSTINVPTATYSADPETAQAFVAGIAEALEIIHGDRAKAEGIAQKEFSNLDPALISAILDRALADDLWPATPEISFEATELALKVARGAGALQDESDPAEFEDVVDLQFVEAL